MLVATIFRLPSIKENFVRGENNAKYHNRALLKELRRGKTV